MGEAEATLSTVRLRRNNERSVNGFLLFVLIWRFFSDSFPLLLPPCFLALEVKGGGGRRMN